MLKGKCYYFMVILAAVLVGILVKTPVYAFNVETLDESDDLQAVKELEDELVELVEYYRNETEITDYAIAYERAVKIYVNTNIYENESLSEEVLRETLEQATYIWEVPIKVGEEKYIICTLNLKAPISEEEQEEYLQTGVFTEEELAEQDRKRK